MGSTERPTVDGAAEAPGADRMFRVTRWSGYVIGPVLFLAFVALYAFPGRTEVYFAWKIHPGLTPC